MVSLLEGKKAKKGTWLYVLWFWIFSCLVGSILCPLCSSQCHFKRHLILFCPLLPGNTGFPRLPPWVVYMLFFMDCSDLPELCQYLHSSCRLSSGSNFSSIFGSLSSSLSCAFLFPSMSLLPLFEELRCAFEKYLHQKLVFIFSNFRQFEASSIFSLLIILEDTGYLWFYLFFFLVCIGCIGIFGFI